MDRARSGVAEEMYVVRRAVRVALHLVRVAVAVPGVALAALEGVVGVVLMPLTESPQRC